MKQNTTLKLIIFILILGIIGTWILGVRVGEQRVILDSEIEVDSTHIWLHYKGQVYTHLAPEE